MYLINDFDIESSEKDYNLVGDYKYYTYNNVEYKIKYDKYKELIMSGRSKLIFFLGTLALVDPNTLKKFKNINFVK